MSAQPHNNAHNDDLSSDSSSDVEIVNVASVYNNNNTNNMDDVPEAPDTVPPPPPDAAAAEPEIRIRRPAVRRAYGLAEHNRRYHGVTRAAATVSNREDIVRQAVEGYTFALVALYPNGSMWPINLVWGMSRRKAMKYLKRCDWPLWTGSYSDVAAFQRPDISRDPPSPPPPAV